MKHKTLTAVFLLMLTVTLLAGCNNEPPKPQAVVINIRTISKAAGINERIKERTETMNQQISEESKALSAKLNKELEDEKARLGDNPPEKDVKKIQTLREQLRKQINQARFAGNTRLANERSEIWQSFRDGVMPVAQVVVFERGASIILNAQAGVFLGRRN
jgi:Skp family chaperone for outer membrane proteins